MIRPFTDQGQGQEGHEEGLLGCRARGGRRPIPEGIVTQNHMADVVKVHKTSDAVFGPKKDLLIQKLIRQSDNALQ